jgi:hypothetical protein
MALAVAEAERVLAPGGRLVDIHPEALPMTLEVWQSRGGAALAGPHPPDSLRRPLGPLEPGDHLCDFAGATQALANAGTRLTQRSQQRFQYRSFFDTLDELHDYLEENAELDRPSDALLERAVASLRAATGRAEVVLSQAVLVTVLEKAGPGSGDSL